MKSPWPTKKLGEICEENIKSLFKVEDATNSGDYPFFTSGESVLTHDEYLVDGENIFLATGGYANVKYYNGKASYSADTWSLKVKNALTKFVFYQILAKLKYIDEVLFRGSGLRHLQKKEFLNLEIPLPPLPIQQKIVKILDTIQEAIDIHDKIIEKTKELKKSLMGDLFKYGAPSFRRGRKLKKTEIGQIPEDWEVVRLGKVLKLSSGKSRPSQISNNQTEKMPYPVYGGNGIIGYSDKFIITHPTIVIGRVGEYCGAVYKTQNFAWITDNALYATDIELQKIDLDFSVHYFNYLNLNKFKKKSGQPLLTQTIIYSISLPLPPLSEQQEIAEILQTIDQKIEIEKRKKELYEELFKTMLNKIMTAPCEINLENIET